MRLPLSAHRCLRPASTQWLDRDQAIAWMRAEGIDERSAAAAWERSADNYQALLRRLARRDLTVAACILGLSVVVAASSYLRGWGVNGYLIALAVLILSAYVARNVPTRLRGRPSAPDLEMQRWMRGRYPHLPGT